MRLRPTPPSPRRTVSKATSPAARAPVEPRGSRVTPGGASFDGVTRAAPDPPVPQAPPGTPGPWNVRLMQSGDPAAAVELRLAQAQARLKVAVEVLPDAAEPSIANALNTSTTRIGTALRSGAISVREAAQAAEQVSDMLDVLLALQQGKARVVPTTTSAGEGVTTWEMHTTAGDAVRVSVRDVGGAAGQARVKFQNIADDGMPIPAAQRLMVRFDLEGSEALATTTTMRATWDVEFGAEKPPPGTELLDKRIHGVILDASGQPVLNRGGRSVGDHHFSQDVPDVLHDAAGFRDFTRAFLDTLEAKATPGSTP